MLSTLAASTRNSMWDELLSLHREELLKQALEDLTNDKDVLAIYLNGSLAKGNADWYSDIDLHIIVAPGRKGEFIKAKASRSERWGDVLFYEDWDPSSPVIVTHYTSFVKVDSWYHEPSEVSPSIWLKGLKVLFDPHNLISEIIMKSTEFNYAPTSKEVIFWRTKVLAFAHETYRAVMREELYYALANIDRIRWLIASGWYMEKDEHLDSPYGVWSKIEGKRSRLHEWQLKALANWECSRNNMEILATLSSIFPEYLRLNRTLSNKVGLPADEESLIPILDMVSL